MSENWKCVFSWFLCVSGEPDSSESAAVNNFVIYLAKNIQNKSTNHIRAWRHDTRHRFPNGERKERERERNLLRVIKLKKKFQKNNVWSTKQLTNLSSHSASCSRENERRIYMILKSTAGNMFVFLCRNFKVTFMHKSLFVLRSAYVSGNKFMLRSRQVSFMIKILLTM